jgi:hypothetical protein
VAKPTPNGNSYPALAEAYVKAYPCLRPFFFQLVPSLKISGEQCVGGNQVN